MGMQFNKPKFDWEVKRSGLSELEQFKQECSMCCSRVHLSEMKDAQKGRTCGKLDRQIMHHDVTFHGHVKLDKF